MRNAELLATNAMQNNERLEDCCLREVGTTLDSRVSSKGVQGAKIRVKWPVTVDHLNVFRPRVDNRGRSGSACAEIMAHESKYSPHSVPLVVEGRWMIDPCTITATRHLAIRAAANPEVSARSPTWSGVILWLPATTRVSLQVRIQCTKEDPRIVRGDVKTLWTAHTREVLIRESPSNARIGQEQPRLRLHQTLPESHD